MKVNQSCPTLCDPMDYTVHEILQARILEWIAFPFSRGSSQPRDWTQVSHIAGGVFTSWTTREATATATAKSLQSCLTLLQPHRRQPTRLPRPWDSPGKNTGVACHFLLQCIKVKVKSLSHVRLFATLWTAAHQAPPSMGFSRQEYWSGVPSPSPEICLKVRILC